jgi:hypothetical protein
MIVGGGLLVLSGSACVDPTIATHTVPFATWRLMCDVSSQLCKVQTILLMNILIEDLCINIFIFFLF